MNKLLSGIAILILAAGGWYAYRNYANTGGGEALYAYECENGMQFSLAPASDYASVRVFPGEGASFPEQTLPYRNNVAGMLYSSLQIGMVAEGDAITLGLMTGTTTCRAVSDDKLDWGSIDATTISPDPSLTIADNLIGAWQRTDDTSLMREFKSDGTYIDRRGNAEVARGLWYAFSDKNAPPVPFDLAENRVYLQIADTDGVAYLQVASMTLASVVLVYMDRPGVLTYNLIQQ